jgi:hypothetical protein
VLTNRHARSGAAAEAQMRLLAASLLVGLAFPAHASMVDVIDGAKKVIYAEIPNPSPEVVDALANAKGRGVSIGLIVATDAVPQQKLARFGIRLRRGEIDTPFVSADCEVVFVDGHTVRSEKEGIHYALRLLGDVMGVKRKDQPD